MAHIAITIIDSVERILFITEQQINNSLKHDVNITTTTVKCKISSYCFIIA